MSGVEGSILGQGLPLTIGDDSAGARRLLDDAGTTREPATEPNHQAAPDKGVDQESASPQHPWLGNYNLHVKPAADPIAPFPDDEAPSTSVFARSGRVATTLLGGAIRYGTGSFLDAMHSDVFDHRDQLAGKALGGYAMGAGMKLFLPERGSFRFIAGTVFLTAIAFDIAKPLVKAVNTAWNETDSQKLEGAKKEFGTSVGEFGWDSVIGLGTAKIGERSVAWGVRKAGWINFESSKHEFFEERRGLIGQFTAPISEGVVRLTARTSNYLSPRPFQREMSKEEVISALQDAVRHLHEETRNLMYKSKDFSGWLNTLTGEGPGGEKPVVRMPNVAADNFKINAILRRQPGFDIAPVEPPADIHTSARPEPKAGRAVLKDGETFPKPRTTPDISPLPDLEGEALRKPEPPAPAKDPPTEPEKNGSPKPDRPGGEKNPTRDAPADGDKTTVGDKPVKDKPEYKKTTTAMEELDPERLKLIAQEIRNEREKWTQSEEDEKKNIPSPAALADYRDMLASSIKTASDPTRSGRLLEPEFDLSANDILKLIESELQDADGMKEAGALLQWHSLATSQIINNVRNALALNLLSKEILGTFLGQMRKLGVKDNLLEGQVPSLSAIANDRGSGNFTVSAMAEMLRRAVTITPRDQSALVAVLGSINYHENLGHNIGFPMIALIARHLLSDPLKDAINDEYRNGVLKAAVKEAFIKNNIEDVDVKVGDTKMKKSELFFKALLDQASENTPDKLGTAAGVVGSPLTLGVLLQSLRPDFQLETRNVFGKEFDLFEPHGFDRWRLKLTAQTMRYLGGGDKLVNDYADAFDAFAQKGSRPGEFYTFASMDNKGQLVRIKQSEWDAIIPEIVRTQFDTPLPSLTTRTGMKPLRQLFPNFVSDFHKINGLAEKIADAVTKGSTTLDGFDAEAFRNQYTIGNTFNANMLAWAKTNARGVDPAQALDSINKIWEPIRDLYLERNPHDVPLTPPVLDRLRAQPITTIARGISRTTGDAIGGLPRAARVISGKTTNLGGIAGAIYGPELLDLNRRTQEMLNPSQGAQPAK